MEFEVFVLGQFFAAAYHFSQGWKSSPGVLFCGGFHSNMDGTKAKLLGEHCQSQGLSYCRFDYRGHGESSGFVEDCCLTDWIDDTKSILEHVYSKSQKVILVGSSMGGWIATHIALLYPHRVVGLIGVATAPDFFTDVFHELSQDQRHELDVTGVVKLVTQYQQEPYRITKRLIDDARSWNLLSTEDGISVATTIPATIPFRLFHGMSDEDVSFEKSLKLAQVVGSTNVLLTLIKGGNHRLCRSQDLKLICHSIDELTK